VAGTVLILCVCWKVAGAGTSRPNQLPPAARKSLRETFPKGRIQDVRARPKIIQVYEVELTEDGRNVKAEVVVNGEILTVYRRLSAANMPGVVARSVKDAMAGGELKHVMQKETHATFSISSFGQPKVQYLATVEKDDRRIQLTFNPDGSLTDRKVSMEKERTVSLDDIPEAARKTILRHAGRHPVREVEIQSSADGNYYEAEWVENGREREIAVAPDGSVVSHGDEENDEEEEENDEDD
jgi:hypothetical protein